MKIFLKLFGIICFVCLTIETESHQNTNILKTEVLLEKYYELEKLSIIRELIPKINDEILSNPKYGLWIDDLYVLDTLDKKRKLYQTINSDHFYYMEVQRQLYDIPLHIYYRLIYKESRFTENVKSPVGAYGYMQVMPQTFDWLKHIYPELFLYDSNCPYNNIRAGTFLCGYELKNRIDKKYPDLDEENRWIFVLSSYNAGIGRYKIALEKFNETIDYVAFIMDGYN